jgi:hypothetical protein
MAFKDRIGAVTTFLYNSDLWEGGGSYNTLGNSFDVSQVGFQPQTGRQGGYVYLFYKPFLNRYGIRQLTIGPNWDFLFLQNGDLDESGLDFIVKSQFKNFWTAEMGYSYDQVRYNRFTPDYQPLPDGSTQVYDNPKIFFEVTSNNSRAVWFNFALTDRFHFVNYPFYFHGRTRNWSGSFNAKIGERIRTAVVTNLYEESFSNGDKFQNRGSIVWRISGNITRKWQARVLMQYASSIDPDLYFYNPTLTDFSRYNRERFAINSLLSYDFNARSALFIGYNGNTYSPQDPFLRGKEVFMKFSYLFSY